MSVDITRAPNHLLYTILLYCDLETGVRGHSRSSKVALFDRAHATLYSSSTVNMSLSIPFSSYSRMYRVGQKVNPKCSTHNFVKYWSIFTILLLLQSPKNLHYVTLWWFYVFKMAAGRHVGFWRKLNSKVFLFPERRFWSLGQILCEYVQ